MKKLLAILITLLICPVFAINWENLKSETGKMFALDVDSIKQEGNYYFYNLKVYTNGTDDIVMTMQCQINHPFCARINKYNLSHYEKLNGNYDNISKNMTNQLKPVPYNSGAFLTHKKVHEIIHQNDKLQITF